MGGDLVEDAALRDRRAGPGRAAERLRLSRPLPRRLRRASSRCSAATSVSATPPSSSSWTPWATTWASCCTRRPRRPSASTWSRSSSRPGGATSSSSWPPRCSPRSSTTANGRAPGPGLGAGHGRPLPHRHRGRGRTDAPDGGLARRPGQAGAHRGAAHLVPARPARAAPDHGGDPQRQSMWSAEMADEFLRATSRDERHYAILKTLGFTSYMTVPLRLRDEQVLGTVSLVSCRLGPPLLREGPRAGRATGQAGELRRHPGPGLRPRAPDLPRAAAPPAARRHPAPSSAGTSRPATGRPASASRSAATGTTWSRSTTTWSPSSSATSRATTSRRPRR